jgi:hypothetical protein
MRHLIVALICILALVTVVTLTGQNSQLGGPGAPATISPSQIAGWPTPVSMTEVGYLDGATSAVQTQLNNRRERLLGSLTGADMNVTTDQAIPIAAAIGGGTRKYVIRRVLVVNASTSLTTAVGGVYTATSKGGSAVIGAGQVYTALTGASKFVDLTIAAIGLSDVRTEANLYLSLTVAQGGAATADVFVFGDDIS